MTDAWIDWESYSQVNIKTAGGMAYARDDSTNPICLGWALDDEPANLWTPREPDPTELLDAIKDGAFIYAHNIKFDFRIWMYKMIEDFGWPALSLDQCVDTQALCATYGLPLSLDKAGEAMHVKMGKLKAGKALIKLLCTPNKKGGQPMWNDPVYQAKFQEFFMYCKRDIDSMREMVSKLPRDVLIPQEHLIWKLTMKMNTNGLPIAYDEVVAIREYLNKYIEQKMPMVNILTKGAIQKVTQTVKIKEWINEQGYPIPNTTAEAVEEALDDPECTGDVRRLLELRQELGKSSVAKFTKLIEQAIPDANGQYWVYDNLEFHGAGPGRWAGRGFQMHNLPRFKLKDPEPWIVKFINNETIEDPVGIAKGLIRPMIKAPKRMQLFVLDYDSIENKVLHWLADDQEALEDFRNDIDQYITMASTRYQVSYEEIKEGVLAEDSVSKGMRQMGKVIILGCIARDTLILTKTGAIPIQNLKPTHKIWDGDNWVSHGGLVNSGLKDCVNFVGSWMTPDHKIYITNEKKESNQWLESTQLENQALCLARDKLSNMFLKAENHPLIRLIESYVRFVAKSSCELLQHSKQDNRTCVPSVTELSIQLRSQGISLLNGLFCSIYQKESPQMAMRAMKSFVNVVQQVFVSQLTSNLEIQPNVKTALVDHCQDFVKIMASTSIPVEDCASACQVLECDVITPLIEITINMVEEESRYIQTGLPHIPLLLCMPSHYRDGMTPVFRSIESITTGTTNPETLGLQRNKKISKIETYDVLNAGPSHRFTILTERGPLLVSNSGFGMGKDTFVVTAKQQFGMIVTDQEASDAIYAYRGKYKLVKKLWNDLKVAAVDAVLTGKRQTVRKITFGLSVVNGTPWLAMRLPSGKCVYYCKPTIEARHIPKYEHMGKVPTIIHHGRHPKTGQWCRIPLIPGRITENAVQGTAREVMAQGLLNVDQKMPEMKLIGTVHDEGMGLVHEKDITENTMKTFNRHLCDISWAEDCPITASGYIGTRYKKD